MNSYLCWIPIDDEAAPSWGAPGHMVETGVDDLCHAASRWLEMFHTREGEVPSHGDEYEVRVRNESGEVVDVIVRSFVRVEYRGISAGASRTRARKSPSHRALWAAA